MLIGLGGEIGSGKSTVAGILVNKNSYHEKFFAKNLKEMFKAVFNCTDEQVGTQEGKARILPYPLPLTKYHLECICHWVQTVNHKKMPDNLESLIEDVSSKNILFKTVREGLQYVGTEICRGWFGDDFHISVVFEEIEREGLPLDKVVISDARFANERAHISSLNGKNILIIDKSEKAKEKEVGLSGHASENSLGKEEDYDYVLFNYKEGMLPLEVCVDAAIKFVELDRAHRY